MRSFLPDSVPTPFYKFHTTYPEHQTDHAGAQEFIQKKASIKLSSDTYLFIIFLVHSSPVTKVLLFLQGLISLLSA